MNTAIPLPGLSLLVLCCVKFILSRNILKVDKIYRNSIRYLIKRGSYTPPALTFPGVHYQSGASFPEEEKWENIKTLWDGWEDGN